MNRYLISNGNLYMTIVKGDSISVVDNMIYIKAGIEVVALFPLTYSVIKENIS